MDRAELQVRRQARGGVQVGPVTLLRVAVQPAAAEAPPGGQRRGLPRLRQRQPGRQVRVLRDAGTLQRAPGHVARAGGRRRAPAVLGPGPVERRVHLERRPVPLGHPARRHRVRRAGPHQRRLVERAGDTLVAGRPVRAEVRADVHRRGTALAGYGRDHVFRLAAPDGEHPAVLAQLLIQRAQRPVHERDPGRAGRPPQRVVQHEQGRHGPTSGRGQQLRVITQTQVPPEPQHGCGHQLSSPHPRHLPARQLTSPGWRPHSPR